MGSFRGDRLRALRKARGEKQADLAAVVGRDRSLITHLERGVGDPSLETLLEIANHYNASPDYLLGWSDSRLPVKNEEAGDKLDQRALLAAIRRLVSESGGPPDLLRIQGPIMNAPRRLPRKGDDDAA